MIPNLFWLLALFGFVLEPWLAETLVWSERFAQGVAPWKQPVLTTLIIAAALVERVSTLFTSQRMRSGSQVVVEALTHMTGVVAVGALYPILFQLQQALRRNEFYRVTQLLVLILLWNISRWFFSAPLSSTELVACQTHDPDEVYDSRTIPTVPEEGFVAQTTSTIHSFFTSCMWTVISGVVGYEVFSFPCFLTPFQVFL